MRNTDSPSRDVEQALMPLVLANISVRWDVDKSAGQVADLVAETKLASREAARYYHLDLAMVPEREAFLYRVAHHLCNGKQAWDAVDQSKETF